MGKRKLLRAKGPSKGHQTTRLVVSRQLKTGTGRVFYCEAGLGAPVILVHGLGASCRWWFEIFPAMTSAHFRLLAPDLPGFGRSTGSLLMMDQAARAVIDFADRVGLRQFFLGGHSMGGAIAAQVAADYGTRVRRLVLIDSAGIPGIGVARVLGRLVQPWSWCPPYFYKTLISDMVRAGPRNLLRSMKYLRVLDIRPTLRQIKTPTLVIWGARDSLTPVDHGHQIASSLSDAQLEIVAGARHIPMVRHAETVARLMIDFYKQDLKERR